MQDSCNFLHQGRQFFEKGLAAMSEGNYKQALKSLSMCLSLEPSPEAYLARARSFFLTKQYENALDDAERAKQLCDGFTNTEAVNQEHIETALAIYRQFLSKRNGRQAQRKQRLQNYAGVTPDLLLAYDLDDLVEPLTRFVKPSLLLRTSGLPDNCGSKLGGMPALPSSVVWPQDRKGRPLSFICQISVTDLVPHPLALSLPHEAMLFFFFDLRRKPTGNLEEFGQWRVICQLPSARPACRPRSLSQEFVLTEIGLTFEGADSLPSPLSDEFASLKTDEDQRDEYWALFEDHFCAPDHRMFGYPNLVLGQMEPECQDNWLLMQRQRGNRIQRAPEDWLLLLQLDSDEDLVGLDWGNGGRIYYWIKKSALRRLDFNDVWLILQSQ